MKATCLLVVAAAVWACAPAQAKDENCTSEMKDESPVSIARYKAFLAKIKWTPKEKFSFLAATQKYGKIKWTCDPTNAGTADECCRSIPVNLLFDTDKPCIVFFPYNRLEISTAHGTLTPQIVWKLRPVLGGDISGFVFAEEIGIAIKRISHAIPQPVGPGTQYDAPQNFQRTSSGQVKDSANHWPVVYPINQDGTFGKECTFYDPLIINTD